MGDWEAVIEQVRHALSAEIGGGDHGSPALAQIQTASTPAVAPPDAP
jgi:hypothetical protein